MEQIKLREKLAYSCGSLSTHIIDSAMPMFLMAYVAITLGLDLFIIGIIMFISKILDAISDLFFGYLVDKKGNARKFLLISAIPFGVCLALLFNCPFDTNIAKYIWFTVFYNLIFSLFYDMVKIPHMTLMTRITQNPKDRFSINTMRMAFGVVTSFLVMLSLEMLKFPREIIWCIIGSGAAVFVIICALGTRERYNQNPHNYSILELKNMFCKRFWLTQGNEFITQFKTEFQDLVPVLLVLSLFGIESVLLVFLLASIPANLISFYFINWLHNNKNINKSDLVIWSNYLLIGMLTLFFIISGIFNYVSIPLVAILVFCIVLTLSPGNMMGAPLCFDVIKDVSKNKNIEGPIFASRVITSKIAHGLASIIFGFILLLGGINQGSPELYIGSKNLLILAIFTIIPAGLSIFNIIIMKQYKKLDFNL